MRTINPTPVWSFKAEKQLRLWYGHVHLLQNRVVGQWFALKRDSGQRLWERRIRRATDIHDIADGVILSDETRSDGPWTLGFGCYGISLETGEMLWRWYGKGLWGKVVQMLDWLPGFTNELRPIFEGVRGHECATNRGHILDVRTGKWLRREADVSAWTKNYAPQTSAQKLYAGESVEITAGRWLSLREPISRTEKQGGVSRLSFPERKRPFGFFLRDAAQNTVCDWGPEKANLIPLTNYYGWRLVGTQLLLLCGEEPALVPIDPRKPLFVRPNPTKYHLLVVDALAGQLVQQMPAFDGKIDECRIEDVDSDGLLLSHDNKPLAYYVWQ